jgi:hypothetical protein
MSNERTTESLTLREMKCEIGKNSFGYVYSQGDTSEVDKIDNLLKKAGGKPVQCSLDDFEKGGAGKANPEYIITFNNDANTIIVIECKRLIKDHVSGNLSEPKKYAVDGVLYYSKFLKDEFNVIAVAISGTKTDNMNH